MLLRFGKCLLICALVFSIGGHWAALQVVAWTGMTVSFSQQDTLGAALSKTFDGKHPCKLCKVVSAGKKAQKESEAKLDTKKLDSFLANSAWFSFPPLKQSVIVHPSIAQSILTAPLSPPPRFA